MNHYPQADLHIHSSYSDGTYPIARIVRRAVELDLKAISITDHDSVRGVDEALELAGEERVTVIPGIEFSSVCGETSAHILGYFIDHHDPQLHEYLDKCENRRRKRTERMVNALRGEGYEITFEQVIRIANGGVLGRPHVAEAVMEVTDKYSSLQRLFRDLLVKGKPGYVPKPNFPAAEIVELIHSIGGVASLAHPKTAGDDSIIPQLVNYGLDAIEVVHSSHSLRDVERYSALADQYNLVVSGGSDCHGGRLGDEVLGKYTISKDQVDRLESRIPANRENSKRKSERLTDGEV